MTSRNDHDAESLRQGQKQATPEASSASTAAGTSWSSGVRARFAEHVVRSKSGVAYFKEAEVVVVSCRADWSNHTQGR